ncbi:hypothetical protein KUV85_09245 [Nocardioides panacisoli]|uniref:hypothetical protein n=1 Tax=Nocardioides panacisoli TaxID=627624 RepID=UPI001C6293E5|nr:hypothetical protein [Nocardioides panacisoli]QYJ02525.1 hypothetical protein KUV85_09245 [Nocardioides panacisoli]
MVRRGARRHLVSAPLLALGITVAGCSASAPSPPTGVDTLEIPTPSPEPADFVAEVDNRWLPLPVGAEWVYAVTGEPSSYQVRVTVSEGPEVLGVATTAVRTEPLVGEDELVTTTPGTDWYAQDIEGNVWWFGSEDGWRAGEAGAEAGLVMAAEPRFGDGYRMAVAGGLDVRAEVTGVDGAGTVELEVYRGENSRTEEYAAGIGLQSWSSTGVGTSGSLQRSDLDG